MNEVTISAALAKEAAHERLKECALERIATREHARRLLFVAGVAEVFWHEQLNELLASIQGPWSWGWLFGNNEAGALLERKLSILGRRLRWVEQIDAIARVYLCTQTELVSVPVVDAFLLRPVGETLRHHAPHGPDYFMELVERPDKAEP